MNEAYFQYAKDLIENMSTDEFEQKLKAAGINATRLPPKEVPAMAWPHRPAFQEKKPRIKLNPETQLYVCHDNYRVQASGETPALAYAHWDIKRSRRMRLARHGRWNKRACYAWANAGCPEIGSYYSYPDGLRQIVGFDFATDEMILRG